MGGSIRKTRYRKFGAQPGDHDGVYQCFNRRLIANIISERLLWKGAHVNRCVKTLGSFLLRDLTSRNAIYIFHSSINVLHQLRSF